MTNRVKEAAGNCSENNVVREEDSFQVDLRVHRVSQDSIYKDEERMTKIQTLVDKLQDGYRTKSIINDLEKNGISDTSREASRLTIKEMGNIELYESCETFRTIQCPLCLKYSKEGTVYCLFQYVLCPRLNKQKRSRMKLTSSQIHYTS